jgi:undecaprenyl-phosphate galactose phosphotransferase
LRKTSLDELPQIWNVLRGEMSLVGLRPITEAELTKYGPHQGLYLALRPGITGPWQVEGRGNRVSYADRVQLDLSYGQNLSLAHDLNLIARTITVLLNPKGV